MRADMSRRRPLAVAATVATAVLASVSCHSYKPLAAPSAVVAQQVKVQFSQPRDITGRTAAGTDSLVRGVSSLEGRIFSATTDTLELTVTRITDAFGSRDVATTLTVKIHPEPSVAIDVLSLDANKTAALAGGTLYAGILVLTIALVAAILSVSGATW
jgi:hypothetical protein